MARKTWIVRIFIFRICSCYWQDTAEETKKMRLGWGPTQIHVTYFAFFFWASGTEGEIFWDEACLCLFYLYSLSLAVSGSFLFWASWTLGAYRVGRSDAPKKAGAASAQHILLRYVGLLVSRGKATLLLLTVNLTTAIPRFVRLKRSPKRSYKSNSYKSR